MKKVCHLTSAHQSIDPRIFYKQCGSLAKAGYETFLVAKGESRLENGVEVVGVPAESGSRIKRILLSSRLIYQKAKEIDADIYEFHDPELLPYGLKLKRGGKKVIFDSHEDYPTQIMEKDWIPKIIRKPISSCYKAYETYVCKRLDAVLFPCTKNGVNIFDGRAQETVIISNAVLLPDEELPTGHCPQSNADSLAPEAATTSPATPATICCTGSLTYQRGITHLIKAAHKAGVRLILAGNYASQAYQRELEAMPEYSCVDYRGYLSREGIAEVYKEAEIGISTILDVGQYSSLDNFPTKVYEYMEAGLPVVATDFPYLSRAMKEDGFGVCVDPQNPDAIAAAVLDILTEPGKALLMGENGRRAVLQKYSWQIEEKKLLALYERLSALNL